jgi:hypothetical protein
MVRGVRAVRGRHTHIDKHNTHTHTHYMQVEPGESCEDQRIWGRCTCDSGSASPGCREKDSASWGAPWASGGTLPAGLSLTCSVRGMVARHNISMGEGGEGRWREREGGGEGVWYGRG